MVAERSVEEPISERVCERIVDVRVPRMAEQVIEASQISSQTRVLESTIEQTFDVPAPEMAEQLVETLKNVSWDRTKRRTVEHIGDIPVPQVIKKLAEISGNFSQDEVRQRSVEQIVEIPTISFAGEIIEMPVIRTQEEIRQVVNPQVQHVVGTDDVENHIVQEKINQMTKHAPRVQIVEKTVEEHFATIAHLASRIPAIPKFGDETGEDPFVKVKSLTTELINKLQDTLERLNKNHLAENDELGFGQACVSERFPEKRGRNLNPESEVFMARIFQIWVNHSRSLGPGSKSRQFSGETNRPGQSKQRQVWVRFEGRTKAVDVGGTEEEVRKRIQRPEKKRCM